MPVSVIIPPSTFYSRIIPYCYTDYRCDRIIIILSGALDFVNDLIPLFYYSLGNVEDSEFANKLLNERLALSMYIQEIEEIKKKLR